MASWVKTICLSTGHITRATDQWLEANQCPTAMLKWDWGYWLWVMDRTESGYDELPHDLRACMDFARARGAEWLRFDADEVIDEADLLPVYDWDADPLIVAIDNARAFDGIQKEP